MQAILGKQFSLKGYISEMAGRIPAEFASIYDYWASEHLDFVKLKKV